MSMWSIIAAIAFVDPFIGTDGTGHTTPAAWYPAGLVQPGPDSGYSSWDHCSGYRSKDATLCGFSQTHLSGTGCPDLADFLLQPFVGENPKVVDPEPKFEHSLVLRAPKLEGSERATPGYYDVTYADSRIRTEITAGPRVAFYRFTAGKGGFKLLVDGQWNNARSKGWIHRTVLDSEMSVGADSRTISGRVHKKCWLERNVRFKAVFDRPFRSAERLPRSPSDRADRWVLDFGLKEGETLLVKTSVSASSAAGVERNLAEVAHWDFDAVRRATEARWEELLGAVELSGCDDERRTAFYTALYHVYLQPVRLSDAGDREFYSAFSIWDTFRAVHPLYTILRPETTAPFVNSFLEHYRREGSLPVMPYFGYDSDCMLGKHTVPVIVDAYLKSLKGLGGLEKVDWGLAYEAVTNALTVTHPQAEKEDWAVYDAKGYYPFDVVGGEGVSRTMEIAYDDWCAARFARARGDAKTADFFFRRAGNWTNVLDRSLGLVRGRDSSGAWRTPFDPFRFGGGKDWLPYDCTEGNAWQYTWHVMQCAPGLVAAHGGERELARRVEKLFALSHPKAPEEPSDCTGQIGEYVHGNEPSHHILYLLPQLHDGNFAAERIREVCDRFYHGGTDGLCGNDDCGQMSAWYVFSAMGFYPFDPCGGEFVLGAPQIPKVTLRCTPTPNTYAYFTVIAKNLSKENKYVKSVTLNGKTLKEPKITYADIMRGGELCFEMWNPIRPVAPTDGARVSAVKPEFREFLALPRAERERRFADERCRLDMVAWGQRPAPIVLRWQWFGRANPTFEVEVRQLPEDRLVFSGRAAEQRMEVFNLELGRDFRWTVRCETFGGEVAAEGRFSTAAEGPRQFALEGAFNLRDLGGWTGLGGRRVRQGLIYRSAGFNDNSTDGGSDRAAWRPAKPRFGAETAAEIVRATGIRTDVDLRSEWETHGMSGSPLGPDVRWVQASSKAYGEMDRPEARAAFAKVFATLKNRRNLPAVFHCITGADRTGTVAYLVNALLGVAEGDLVADWETTALYNTYGGFTHAKIAKLEALLDGYPGVTRAEKAAAYVKDCGFTDEDIAEFREMMLE